MTRPRVDRRIVIDSVLNEGAEPPSGLETAGSLGGHYGVVPCWGVPCCGTCCGAPCEQPAIGWTSSSNSDWQLVV